MKATKREDKKSKRGYFGGGRARIEFLLKLFRSGSGSGNKQASKTRKQRSIR